jgi:hypothetical protein
MKCATVEPVGAPGAGTLLLREPDLFFGDVSELRDGGNTAGGIGRDRQGAAVVDHERRPVLLPSS